MLSCLNLASFSTVREQNTLWSVGFYDVTLCLLSITIGRTIVISRFQVSKWKNLVRSLKEWLTPLKANVNEKHCLRNLNAKIKALIDNLFVLKLHRKIINRVKFIYEKSQLLTLLYSTECWRGGVIFILMVLIFFFLSCFGCASVPESDRSVVRKMLNCRFDFWFLFLFFFLVLNNLKQNSFINKFQNFSSKIEWAMAE